MRKAPGPGGRQANGFKQLGHAVLAIRFFHVLMQPQRLPDDLLHRHARVERGEGILKNNLQLAPELVQRAPEASVISSP